MTLAVGTSAKIPKGGLFLSELPYLTHWAPADDGLQMQSGGELTEYSPSSLFNILLTDPPPSWSPSLGHPSPHSTHTSS